MPFDAINAASLKIIKIWAPNLDELKKFYSFFIDPYETNIIIYTECTLSS